MQNIIDLNENLRASNYLTINGEGAYGLLRYY